MDEEGRVVVTFGENTTEQVLTAGRYENGAVSMLSAFTKVSDAKQYEIRPLDGSPESIEPEKGLVVRTVYTSTEALKQHIKALKMLKKQMEEIDSKVWVGPVAPTKKAFGAKEYKPQLKEDIDHGRGEPESYDPLVW